MTRGSDAMGGLMLALVGIGILVLWRSGALKQILGISAPATRDVPSVIQTITKIAAPDAATKLPTASLAPITLAPNAPASVGAAGLPDNGISSTWMGSPSYSVFRRGERDPEWWGNPDAAKIVSGMTTPAAVITGGGGGSAAISAV